MKILLFFLLMFTNIFSYSQWLKVFEDNFDGEQLNKSKWHDRRPWGDWPPDVEPDITLPKNVELSNGYLYLYLINENNYYHQTYYDNNSPIYFYPFSRGMIWSKPKFKYGIYEAKILLPKDKINWSAFWLFNGQEIDIFEQFNITNNSNKVDLQSTIHSDGELNVKSNKKNRSFLDNWHVYTLLWDNYNDNNANIDIQFDGNREARFKKRNNGYIGYGNNKVKYPTKPMSVILCAGAHKNYPLDEPQIMIVDYINVWQKINCNNDVTLCYYNPNEDNNVFSGRRISTGANCTINLNEQDYLYLFATQEIHLKPGFHASSGSNFRASIVSCPNKNLSLDSIFNNRIIQNVTINNSNENIYIYPNPTKDIVFIELLNEIDSYKYSIYDTYGKLILSNSLNYGLNKLNISCLLNGFYFIKIYSENNSYVKKLIVL